MARQIHLFRALCVFLVVFSTQVRAAEAEEAAEAFESLYGADVQRVKATQDPKDDVKLAARLLAAAKKATGRPEFLTILCQNAYDLAICWPDGYPTAIEAVELLASEVPNKAADCHARKLGVVELQYKASKGSAKTAAGKAYLDVLLTVAESHIARGNAEKADELYRKASAIARYIRSPRTREITARQRQLVAEAAALKKRQTRLKVLHSKLYDNPADTDTRRELILLYVLELDDPGEAIGLLSDDLDKSLRRYVPGAAKPVETAPELACLQLAVWYEQLATEASEAGRVTAFQRAAVYYRRYLALHAGQDASGLSAPRALEAIEKELAKRGMGGIGLPPGLSEGLVLYYGFDKDHGWKVADKSGKGNHGKVHGATWVRDARGWLNGAYAFDGEKAYIDAGNPLALQIVEGQTIAMWIRPRRLNARRNPFNKSYGGEGTITMVIGGCVNYFYGTAGTDARPYTHLTMTDALQANEWAHLVLVRDVKNGRLRWFKNGKQTNEGPAKYPKARPSRKPVYLGRGYVEHFIGLMDDVMIWNRALSKEDVKQLYRATGGK